jgi:P27 family predicted phage terminase small subunit
MSGSKGPLSEQREDVRKARGMDPRHADTHVAEVEIPTCPTFLKGEARREWGRITALLAKQGRVSGTDRAMLVGYCVAWWNYRRTTEALEAAIAEDGIVDATTTAGSRGQATQATLVKNQRDFLRDMQSTAQDLGLSVSQRLRLPAAEGKPQESKLDELARRRAERRAKRRQSNPT